MKKKMTTVAFAGTPEQEKAADINNDGRINSIDSNYLTRIAAGVAVTSNNLSMPEPCTYEFKRREESDILLI